MKNKLVLPLLLLCISLAGCGASQTAVSSENTETVSTEATENTEAEIINSETEESMPSTEENLESADQAATEKTADSTETAENTDEFGSAYKNLLKTILDVQAGSAGCSLRAENAASEISSFAKSYADQMDQAKLKSLTTEWISAESESDPYIKDELAECMLMVSSEIESSDAELASSTAYTDLSTVINEACQ